MLSAPMRAFRQLVFTRADVRERLRVCASDEAFVVASVALADDLGIVLTEHELREALNAGQREWIERWI